MIGDYNLNIEEPQQEPTRRRRKFNPVWLPQSTKVIYRGRAVILPPEDVLRRFAEAYPDTPAAELSATFGMSEDGARRLGQYLGIEKSHDFRVKTGKKASAKAHSAAERKRRSERMNHKQAPGLVRYFEERRKMTMTEEEHRICSERIRKGWEVRRKTIEAERRRVNWGLPQQTKMVVIKQPRVKTDFRYRLKQLGYTEEEKNVFVAPRKVRERHQRIEANASQFFKFYSIHEYRTLKAN